MTELPESTAAFADVDKRVRACIAKCTAGETVLQTCTEAGFLQDIEDMFHKLQQCEKALLAYVESTQRAFPRFYFLSNDELLSILSQTRNPQAVQEHLCKSQPFRRKKTFRARNPVESHYKQTPAPSPQGAEQARDAPRRPRAVRRGPPAR